MKREYEITHRFEKKPLAKCYCIHCRGFTSDNDHVPRELAERKISLKDFFDLLNVWEGMRYAEKGIVIRKLVEEEKK